MARLAAQRTRCLNYLEAALNEPIHDRVHLDKNPTLTMLIPGMLMKRAARGQLGLMAAAQKVMGEILSGPATSL